jgi:hypothetical protein
MRIGDFANAFLSLVGVGLIAAAFVIGLVEYGAI